MCDVLDKMADDENTPAVVGSRPRTLRWTVYHFTVFMLTFWGYASYHATRKTFSNVKSTMSATWTPAPNDSTWHYEPRDRWTKNHLFEDEDRAEYLLGLLDTLFLVTYAVGLYISGIIGDRYDMRKVLSFGMMATAICVFLFGTLSEWLKIYNMAWYISFWMLCALIQSTGWPSMVAVMANWFGKSSRGVVLGLWSSCASVGNIIGSLLVSAVIDFGYEYAFLMTSGLLFGCGVIIFFGLVPHPRDVGLPSPDEFDEHRYSIPEGTIQERYPSFAAAHGETNALLGETSEDDEESVDATAGAYQTDPPPKEEPQEAMSFWKALLLPGVLPYSLSYACLKMVNYSFFFWLPFYLTDKFGWTQADADSLSIWYDVGGIISGTIGGIISDLLGVRSPVCGVLLVLSFPALWGYSVSPEDKMINAVLMAVAGFFVGGPANLISSAISADLGRQGEECKNKQALATVTGIVDGTGSVGGGLGQLLIPVIQLHLGWKSVFYLFMIMMFLTLVCIARIIYRETRELISRCFGHSVSAANEEWDNIDADDPLITGT